MSKINNFKQNKKLVSKHKIYTVPNMTGGNIATWIGISAILVGLVGSLNAIKNSIDNVSPKNILLYNEFKKSQEKSQKNSRVLFNFSSKHHHAQLGTIMVNNKYLNDLSYAPYMGQKNIDYYCKPITNSTFDGIVDTFRL